MTLGSLALELLPFRTGFHMLLTLSDGVEHVFYFVLAINCARLPILLDLLIIIVVNSLLFIPMRTPKNSIKFDLLFHLMLYKPLLVSEVMLRAVLAAVNDLAPSITTSANVMLPFVEGIEPVVGIERTNENFF